MEVAPEPIRAELVLVGAGHAHIQILRRWMMKPLPGVRLSVVLDRPEAVYSGMVPGLVAGDYEPAELEIDAIPLARRAGARVILAAATRIDPAARRIEMVGRPPISYDVASLDVGSTVRGLDVPGVMEHALATRPICELVDSLEARMDRAASQTGGALRVAVVGGGAAGVELAFTLEHRLRAAKRPVELSLLTAADSILLGAPHLARVAAKLASERGILVRTRANVVAVEKDRLRIAAPDAIAPSEEWPCDLAVWAAGAAPIDLVVNSPLPVDSTGCVRVDETLCVVGHSDLFAVGDCARQDAHPWVPRAGVYAVRQGPVLDLNLRARLEGQRLRAFEPQRDFLALLNLGGRRALGGKWKRARQGRAVWHLKDWIDRRFVRRFQVLDAHGVPARAFPSPESMGMEEMACGGCAAKVGADPLARALARLDPAARDDSVLVGLDAPDDAAALRLPGGDVVLATVDGFRAFADDPYLVGRVAAVNAVSDVFAKGGTPRHVMAMVTVPETQAARAEETLYQVLAGVRAALDPLGATLVGGHSTTGTELFVGLSVMGTLPDKGAVLPLAGLRPGDALLLTKALGTGVVLAADMRGLARGQWVRATYESMLRPNDVAAEVACAVDAHACTDVSGFGLAGHLLEMLRASGVSAELEVSAIPHLDGARGLMERGVRSTFHAQNVGVAGTLAGADANPILFDPQTSGGLLLGVPSERAAEALRAFAEAGEPAVQIGRVVEEGPERLEVIGRDIR